MTAGTARANHTIAVLPDMQLAPLFAAYRAAAAARRFRLLTGAVIAAAVLALSFVGAEVEPRTFWAKIGNAGDYFFRLAHLDTGAPVWTDPAEWFWGLKRWTRLLGETLLIAYVGTAVGVLGAFAACFVASERLVGNRWGRAAARRVLEVCRTVPDLVFALIFVVAFGLGPLPGVMALAIHTAGALGKLFAEIVDNIDMKPVEGVAAAGGSWFARVRFGVVPQVLASFASYSLLRFEINVRGASVLGFVGAGGIGEELIIAIRRFYYADVSAILLLIVFCVMLIDMGSAQLRHSLARLEGAR